MLTGSVCLEELDKLKESEQEKKEVVGNRGNPLKKKQERLRKWHVLGQDISPIA